jgi:PAS domain S-box-containing protein
VPHAVTDLDGWTVGAEDVLAAVLQSVAQPIWVVDPEGLIRFANPAAVDTLGYAEVGELLGRHSHETIHYRRPDGSDYPASECPMLLPRTTGETVARDVDWFFRRDGTMFAVSYVSVPIAMPGGRGAVVAFTDIEDRLRAEAVLHDRDAVLTQDQAALRRVATLVAQGAEPANVFSAVAREVGRLANAQMVLMSRYEPDGTAIVIGAWGDHPLRAGARWTLDGPSISATVLQTGRTARFDDAPEGPGAIADVARDLGVHSRVGVPIVVDGRIWGVVAVGATDRRSLPAGIETRLEEFTELVATAISNSQAHEDLRRLAEEQAALRRLATLVAQGAESRLVFDAVCEETGRLFAATTVNLAHFTPDGFNLTIAGWSLRSVHVPTGTRLPLEGDTVNNVVRRTAAPGRFDSYEGASGELAARLRGLGIRSEVGAPVVVEGRVWGALVAGTDEPVPLPAGTELRLADFAELIATAVSNATSQAELVSSRARIVQAADEQRRRVVRDLHDGAQQRLVTAVIALQLAQGRRDLSPELRSLVETGLGHAEAAIEELRDLAQGIHPAILTHHGLAAAVEALADRAPLLVEVEIPDDRYPGTVESAAYFVVAEALTNVAKYARASTAGVTARQEEGRLLLTVEDDGAGGAARRPGGGLAGLGDRVAALDGTLSIESPVGAGTTIRALIPLPDPT